MAHGQRRIEDTAGGRIDYTLDAMGNRTREDVRDANGTLRQTRTRVFSTLNRLAQERGALGQVTAMAYDNEGNRTSINGPLAGTGDTTRFAYAALNRLIRVTAPDTGQVRTTLNALDQATQIIDPRNLATVYAQNALGNHTRLTSPDTGITNRTLDAAGRTVTRTFDALNRMFTEVHVRSGRPTVSLGFTRDQGTHGLGRLTGVTAPSGSTVLEYDARARLTVRRQMVGGVTTELRFTRDAQGRLYETCYPSGRQVRYAYDLQGRVNRIDLGSQPILQNITYHPFGPAVSGTYWNGVAWSRPLDTDGRVASYRVGNAAIHVPGYDLASRITSLTQPAPWGSHTFGYDTSDRLTNWTHPRPDLRPQRQTTQPVRRRHGAGLHLHQPAKKPRDDGVGVGDDPHQVALRQRLLLRQGRRNPADLARLRLMLDNTRGTRLRFTSFSTAGGLTRA